MQERGAEAAQRASAAERGEISAVEDGREPGLIEELPAYGMPREVVTTSSSRTPLRTTSPHLTGVPAQPAEHLSRGEHAAYVGGDDEESGGGSAESLHRGLESG